MENFRREAQACLLQTVLLFVGASRVGFGPVCLAQTAGTEFSQGALVGSSGPEPTAAIPPSVRLGVMTNPGVVSLAAINRDNYLQEDAAQAAAGGMASLRAGVSLPLLVPVLSDDAQAWTTAPDGGRIWATTVSADQAFGVRVHFVNLALPAGAELWIYSPKYANAVQGPIVGRGPFGDGEYWSTVIAGESATVELFLPAGVALPGDNQLVLDELHYLYRNPIDPYEGDSFAAREGPCHCDVMCYSAWQPLHNATGRALFQQQGTSVFCSGVLLNTLANDQTPLFISANHCCSTQVIARTTVVWWFYQTLSCNGTVPQLANVPSSSDADFLAGADINVGSDYGLVQLRGALPNGLTWAGWDASGSLPVNLPVADVHHPEGAYKRIMFGNVIPYPFSELDDPNYFIGVGWAYCGTIELGSSGSPLYRTDTQQFVGQVSHTSGPVGCDNLYGPSAFGKLAAYYPTIQPYLQAGSDDGLEGMGNGSCATATPLTPGTYDNLVVKRTNEDWYRISMIGCDSLTATATFNNDYGNIELGLYDGCGGNLISTSTSTGNFETVSAAVGGGPRSLWLRVYLSYGVRNTYSLTVTRTGGCSGDLNCDQVVDLSDLSILISNYGHGGAQPGQGDLNGDQVVDLSDLSKMLSQFGTTCP